MIWSWIPQNWSLIWQLTWENAKLGVLSALYGLIISLPLGIIAGLRVAVVSSISLATVGQLIGVSSLGYLFVDGLQRSFPTEIFVGLFLIVVLALICDLILVGLRRVLTPWAPTRSGPLPAFAALRSRALVPWAPLGRP